jgi:phage N-6-adenine-methyltransferase
MSIDLFTSQQTDEWSSPREVVEPIAESIGGFDLDPCSGAERSPFADECYTEDEDGLGQWWHGDVWVNPPYSDIQPWIDRIIGEVREDGLIETDTERIILLCKGDSSTQWWHRTGRYASAVCFIEGRLSFGDAGNSAPFPSHMFVFGDVHHDLARTLSTIGSLCSPRRRQ